MSTYSNADIARKYNVSRSTVTLWVQGAQKGKNNLQLTQSNNKVQVLKNEHNEEELMRLCEEGKKYKSRWDYIETTVKDEFYKIFNPVQTVEIINTLKTRREINLKFTYLNGGASIWDQVCVEAENKGTYAALNNTPKMLSDVVNFLSRKTSDYSKINIIDIAPGNSFPVKEFVKYFYDKGILNKYISVDISSEMNQISQGYLKSWFPNLQVESYVRDIELNNVSDICFDQKNDDSVVNILLFVGGTIGNFWDQSIILNNLQKSLDDEDILIIGNKLGTYISKTTLSYVDVKHPIHVFIPELLGINSKDCGTAFKYDEKTRYRVGSLVLDKNYNINFKLKEKEISVELLKGEELTVWIHGMWDIPHVIQDLNASGLELIQLTTEKNLNHVLVVCQNQSSIKIN